MSTELADDWSTLAAKAQARVSQYKPQQHQQHANFLPVSLNAFITWLPEGGRECLARDIIGSKSDNELYDIFSNLLTGPATPMRARSKPPSVSPSPHAKREAHVEAVAATLTQPEKRTSQFKELCLKRDDNRCVITGELDIEYWEELNRPEEPYFGRTEGAHIIPFCYASWESAEVLYRCFPLVRQVQEGISTETINDTSNGMTLRANIHDEFRRFTIALKPTNVYEVKTFPRFPKWDISALPTSSTIHLTQADDAQDVALPKAALLDCHYRLSEILNASGMGHVIDRYLRDWEDIKCEAPKTLDEAGRTNVNAFLQAGLWEHALA
ncbi:unnamed protein product [Penicillium roqueforti FM164]|uniref:Genomic scaffold, ProqFM164S04 n=1 Tax=Penicillium roqueforti (strain FM164) TaxID=1365484 RepID=W6R0P9_PENRF|nr:unnamed protein product [Penicillium roqueforti FM164]